MTNEWLEKPCFHSVVLRAFLLSVSKHCTLVRALGFFQHVPGFFYRLASIELSRMKYCPLCRSELAHRNVDGRTRLGCSAAECRFVHWENPIPVVASLVRLSDSYVLARNAKWPAGLFSFLTGFIENGEAPESAAVRETEEELGIQAQSAHLIGHFPLAQLNQLVIAYEVRAAGELTLSDEIAEIKVVSPAELATFNFGPLGLTSEIVSTWLRRERRTSAQSSRG